jgi:hypothetical protein
MFIALLISLPTGRSTVRMRVWRSLTSTGCGVLRDGVYLLPAGAAQAPVFAQAESDVRAAGGFAMTVELKPTSPAQLEHLRQLFDRGNEYGALVKKLAAARGSLARLGRRKADTLAQRLRRAYQALAESDYFPGEAQQQAQQALAALESDARSLLTPGEPRPGKGRVRRLDPARYRRRVWATRSDLWVDRLASAWLIQRFIDPAARFLWLEQPRQRPKTAVGFDFDGAEFTHIERRITFEVLLRSFDLERDPALVSIGHAVHYLDAGGIPVAEAKGLEILLRGIKANAGGDDRTFAEAAKVFDLFYSAYASREPEKEKGGTAPALAYS